MLQLHLLWIVMMYVLYVVRTRCISIHVRTAIRRYLVDNGIVEQQHHGIGEGGGDGAGFVAPGPDFGGAGVVVKGHAVVELDVHGEACLGAVFVVVVYILKWW